MKYIARLILKLLGWRIEYPVPKHMTKAVVTMAPHTSNWDFVIGRLAFFSYGISPNILIKKEAFTPLAGPLLRWLGGIPVDRGQSQNTVKSITDEFHRNDSFYLLIAPEGTRKRVNKWKKGFYFIALTARVPIFLGYLNYKTKEGGVGMIMEPSGDFEADFKTIEDFYRDKHALHPEKFNLTNS